jgi:hypothetical protein
MSTPNHLRQNNIRPDAWRAQLLQEQVREEMGKRRKAAAMRAAVAAGIVVGVFGSVIANLI